MGPANASAGARCANCEQQRDSGLLSTALVPLTIPVYQAFTDGTVTDVSDLRKDNVEPYLKDNLNWVAVRVRCSPSIFILRSLLACTR